MGAGASYPPFALVYCFSLAHVRCSAGSTKRPDRVTRIQIFVAEPLLSADTRTKSYKYGHRAAFSIEKPVINPKIGLWVGRSRRSWMTDEVRSPRPLV